ncbi:MAG: hypothetical protein C4584_01285 [Armatimonadetes bacterium]|nr:MAG: hypothetical protein C4584_01285 [Armatimonadota bacterium]
MGKKITLIVFLSIGLLVWWIYGQKNGMDNTSLVGTRLEVENTVIPTLTTVPMPTPFRVDRNTDLNAALEQLDPENFSDDFQSLRQDADGF